MVPRRVSGWAVLFWVCAVAAPVARAQEYPPIVDRRYTLDLHQGAALGSGRVVGMGGAAMGTASGSAGALVNPAAAAVRSETSTRRWDWDWHIDYLSTALGSDFDNNGIVQEREFGLLEGPLVTAGLVGQIEEWGLAVNGTTFRQTVVEGGDDSAEPTSSVARIALARSFRQGQFILGVGARIGEFSMTTAEPPEGEESPSLFSIGGSSLEIGAMWHPRMASLRVGATASAPVTGDEVTSATCDPLDCQGTILPSRAALPWQVAGGVAWRFGPTPWNRTIRARWRDEKYWLLAADAVVTGAVRDGHGLEAFARGQLQPSGRDVGVSLRAGVEHEWVPGWFRVRGGSYWEPSRFRDPAGQDIRGRLHVTLGLDIRLLSFCFWNERYRTRLSLTSDVAERYGNGGVAVGLWH